MKIKCKFLSLGEVSALKHQSVYSEMIKPLDCDLGLIRNAFYIVVGILTRSGTPWLYVIEEKERDLTPQLIPAVLFEFDFQLIPSGWGFRLVEPTKEDVEILPHELANVPNWYEHVIDEEEEAMLLMSKIFNELKNL